MAVVLAEDVCASFIFGTQNRVSNRFMWFMGCRSVLSTSHFTYMKALCSCDALLCVSLTLQNALVSGQEASIVKRSFRLG